MSNTLKMAALLRELRRQTNGAVVGAMESRGVEYGLSYGVSVASIRVEAAQYAPDHPFALFLYGQDVRELRIAATYIADPSLVTEEELRIWAGGIATAEIAEHVAMMLARTHVSGAAVGAWIGADDRLVAYAALMCGAHAAAAKDLDVEAILQPLSTIAASGDRLWDKGLAALLPRLWRRPALHHILSPLLDDIRVSNPALWQQLEWQLE